MKKSSSIALASGLLLASVSGAAFYAHNYIAPQKIQDAIQSQIDQQKAVASGYTVNQKGAVKVEPTSFMTYKITLPAAELAAGSGDDTITINTAAQTYGATLRGGSILSFARSIVNGDAAAVEMKSTAPIDFTVTLNHAPLTKAISIPLYGECASTNVSWSKTMDKVSAADCTLTLFVDDAGNAILKDDVSKRITTAIHFSGATTRAHGETGQSKASVLIDQVKIHSTGKEFLDITGKFAMSYAQEMHPTAAATVDTGRAAALADIGKKFNLSSASDKSLLAGLAGDADLAFSVSDLKVETSSDNLAALLSGLSSAGLSAQTTIKVRGMGDNNTNVSISEIYTTKSGPFGPAGEVECNAGLGNIPESTLTQYFQKISKTTDSKLENVGDRLSDGALPLAYIANAAKLSAYANCHIKGMGLPGDMDTQNAFALSGNALTGQGSVKLDGMTGSDPNQFLSQLPPEWALYAALFGNFLKPSSDNKSLGAQYVITKDGKVNVNGQQLGQMPQLPPLP